MYNVECAALKYYNSAISEECLYIGMLYNNLTTRQRNFRYISNYNRLQLFDDEVDINFIKLYLKGIKQQVEDFDYTDFSIAEFTKIYVNELRFTDIMDIKVKEDEDYVENLTKLYLKFDFSKNNRLTNKEEKQYIKRILSSKNIQFAPVQVKGTFDENIVFDYIVNNMAIKIFYFKNKNSKRIISSAKQWSFTAEELKDKMQVIFLHDDFAFNDSSFEIILNILKKNAYVFPIQEGLSYVLSQIA